MAERPAFEHRQHLEVETPEHVVLDYEIAGIGSRTLAALGDWLILFVLLGAGSLGLGVWRRSAPWIVAVLLLGLYAAVWLYFSCFEGLRRGQTPGKRWLGIRVIRDTGHAVTFSDAAARNLLLPIDLFCLIGVFFIAIHPRGKRIGDLVAGTVVVRDHPVELRAAPAPAEGAGTERPQGVPELSDEEFRLVREYSRRAAMLPPEVRDRLARGLAARFTERYPGRPADDGAFLEALHRDELARRRGRFGARTRSRSGVAERLLSRKSGRWAEFQRIAERVTRGGLDALGAEELPDFAARYREVSADLARARTYGADAETQARLSRLVATGHNALYREERKTWSNIWGFFSREAPAAVVGAGRTVLLAAMVFLLPGL
ncbi:MAG TPA: RDD family protein, partial [Gemmatimonadales bacterium]